VHQVVSVDLAAPTELGDAFEPSIYLLNAAKLLLIGEPETLKKFTLI